MPHKFNIGDGTARGTYTITGLMPGLEEPTAEYRTQTLQREFERRVRE
jgi:hypothetical protein